MANPTPNGRAGVGGRKKRRRGGLPPSRYERIKTRRPPPPPLPPLWRHFVSPLLLFFFFLEGKGSADGGGVGRPRLYGRTQGGGGGGGECAALGWGDRTLPNKKREGGGHRLLLPTPGRWRLFLFFSSLFLGNGRE